MTHMIDSIEQLKERLSRGEHINLYEISAELDSWIIKYYNQKYGVIKLNKI